MAQRLRCPGGRPVSYERVRSVAISLDTKYQLQATANANKTQTNCRLPESAKGKGHGWPVPRSINQGLVAEEHAC